MSMEHADVMTARDAAFVYAETGSSPLHVGMLAILEDRGATIGALRRHLASRLHRFPRLRQKLAWVPHHQGHPVWVDAEDLDLSEHVMEGALPEPGGLAEAKRYVARAMSTPLPRSRPLWEMHLLPMSEQRLGLVFKIHHCLLDGVSAAHLVTVLFDIEPTAPPSAPRDWVAAPAPSERELLEDAARSRRQRLAELREAARQWRPSKEWLHSSLDRVARAAGEMVDLGKAMLVSPRRVSLCDRVGPYRRFEGGGVDLEEIKSIKRAGDCKLNDVVLAMVGDALGRLLRARGIATTQRTIKAFVPVSRRGQQSTPAYGNNVSMMAVDLPVEAMAPDQRLGRVAARMTELKASGQSRAADLWMNVADHMPPALVSLVSRAAGMQSAIDVVVTNVPGPPFPLYLLGGKMLEVYPYVPLFGATALGIAVVSYDGKLYFGLSGDWDAMSDLDRLREALLRSFDELRSSTTSRSDQGESNVAIDHRRGIPSRDGTEGQGRVTPRRARKSA
jgi:WS/DGAT/MGAT family acyltransferase